MPSRSWPGMTQVTVSWLATGSSDLSRARPRVLGGGRLADPDRPLVAGAKPAAARRPVDLDRRRAPAEQPAVLEHPRKLAVRRAPFLAGQDARDRLALIGLATFVDVEEVRPRGARLVVG